MDSLMNFEHRGFSLRSDQDRPTILIIGERHRTFLRDALNEIYRIEEVSTSEEGIRFAKREVPDLIITALTAESSDNESLCFQLKHSQNTNHIPLVILSEINDPSNRMKSFYFGADDYMWLPLQDVELQIRIENLIQSRRTLLQKFSKEVQLKPSFEVQSKDERFLHQIKTVMNANIDNYLFGSEQFADQLGVSHRHLSRKLMALTGQSCNEFIRQTRLRRAAELLKKQTGNVKEVAHQVGFNNLSYFAKCFKEFHNYLPSDYSKTRQ
jgi:AraC-like DNA-binding protein